MATILIADDETNLRKVLSAMHEQSSRKEEPFIRVNCAAIPRELLESEFFGYEQGAFTGAVGSKPGRFELADRGTLLLDEIAEIPIEMQVKLLRALQESEFERVGGVRTMKVDVRVIAATNRDLAGEIAAGNFREDLYYRLDVVPVPLPALRERAEDVPLLCQFFVDKYAQRLKRDIRGLSPEAERVLQSHTWPGNIRELENVIERAMLFAESPVSGVAELPEAIRGAADSSSSAALLAPPSTATPDEARSEFSDVSLKDIVRKRTSELERHLIQGALEQTGGNVTRAAERLQISRKGLQNKMKELGLREE